MIKKIISFLIIIFFNLTIFSQISIFSNIGGGLSYSYNTDYLSIDTKPVINFYTGIGVNYEFLNFFKINLECDYFKNGFNIRNFDTSNLSQNYISINTSYLNFPIYLTLFSKNRFSVNFGLFNKLYLFTYYNSKKDGNVIARGKFFNLYIFDYFVGLSYNLNKKINFDVLFYWDKNKILTIENRYSTGFLFRFNYVLFNKYKNQNCKL